MTNDECGCSSGAGCGCAPAEPTGANAPRTELKPLENMKPLDPFAGRDRGCSSDSAANNASCCGSAPAPSSSLPLHPGYQLMPFVTEFRDGASHPIPVVTTRLGATDRWGAFLVRLGVGRDRYAVAPGLYAVGCPDEDSPVIATCNYKLTFDILRCELDGLDAWALCVDTRGINVWCAASKKTFSTAEVVKRIKIVGLDRVVRHRTIILPQLSATGVSALEVKRGSGFSAIFGPVRAADLPAFIKAGNVAAEPMRRATFTLRERAALIPVEMSGIRKYLPWLILGAFLLSGVGPSIFSLGAAWLRGLLALAATLGGILAGAAAVPLLLPWIPGKAFALKGIITGLLASGLLIAWQWAGLTGLECLSLLLWLTALSSFAAMNFTGATPFTSPSGVEKEMRTFIPVQAGSALVAIAVWVAAEFLK